MNPALTDCENRPTCSYDIIDSFCERIQHIPALCKNPGPHHPWIPATCCNSGGTTTCVPADLRGTMESPAYAVCTGMTLWASGCACRSSRRLKVALFAQAVLWSFGSFGRVSQVNVQENGSGCKSEAARDCDRTGGLAPPRMSCPTALSRLRYRRTGTAYTRQTSLF